MQTNHEEVVTVSGQKRDNIAGARGRVLFVALLTKPSTVVGVLKFFVAVLVWASVVPARFFHVLSKESDCSLGDEIVGFVTVPDVIVFDLLEGKLLVTSTPTCVLRVHAYVLVRSKHPRD